METTAKENQSEQVPELDSEFRAQKKTKQESRCIYKRGLNIRCRARHAPSAFHTK
jgi:hypothetical protein